MRKGFVSILIAFTAAAVHAAGTGSISGSLDTPAVKKLTAVNRTDDKRYLGEVDATTGKFTIKGLPLNATYDVIIEAGDATLEGVNLNVPHSDFEIEQPMTKDDVKAVTEAARALNPFENNVEVMTVVGNVQHAAVLLNKTRTTPFVNQAPGEMIWRVEVWQFEKPEETWIKDRSGDLFVVLHRERLQKADFEKKSLTLDPTLGGVVVTEKRADVELGKVVLPSSERGVRLRGATAGGK